jgi:hypothetical protein
MTKDVSRQHGTPFVIDVRTDAAGEFFEILKTRRKAKQWGWRQLPYHPDTYVRGSISHPDHATIHLDCCHRVEVNQESQPTAQRIAFAPRRLTTITYRD